MAARENSESSCVRSWADPAFFNQKQDLIPRSLLHESAGIKQAEFSEVIAGEMMFWSFFWILYAIF